MEYKKKHILIFSTAYHPFIGGAEIAIQEIIKRLPEYAFTLVTARLRSDLPQKETIGNVIVHRIGKGSRWDKFQLLFLGKRYAEAMGSFDCVWSVMASYAGFAGLFYKKKHPNVPFLLTLQEGDSFSHIYSRVWFVWPWFRQIFTKADRIQAISAYLADWAGRMGAVCPVDVVPNGIDMKHGTENKEQKYGAVKRVITVSRLVKKNGVEDLILAMKIVNEQKEPPVALKIIGDGVLRKRLKLLAKDLDLEKSAAILGKKELRSKGVTFEGPMPHKEVYNRLQQADVFVRPSLSEGLGNAFLEAMAMGVPVIGTKVGGILDFLIEGETGWFCDVKNPKSIAEKILYVLDERNKEQVEKVVEKAKKMVEEKYNWDLIAQHMRNIFQSVQSIKNQ